MSVLEGWLAARVVRKHTLPHHRQENLAEHTWGVLHILFSIYPAVPGRTVKGAMYHDIGEHRSGDIPGDFKAEHPEIREVCEKFEEAAARVVLPVTLHHALSLNRHDLALIKFCDKLEFAFSCYHEWMMGNRYSLAPMERTLEAAAEAIPQDVFDELPDYVRENIHNTLTEVIRLCADMRKQMQPNKEIRFAS